MCWMGCRTQQFFSKTSKNVRLFFGFHFHTAVALKAIMSPVSAALTSLPCPPLIKASAMTDLSICSCRILLFWCVKQQLSWRQRGTVSDVPEDCISTSCRINKSLLLLKDKSLSWWISAFGFCWGQWKIGCCSRQAAPKQFNLNPFSSAVFIPKATANLQLLSSEGKSNRFCLLSLFSFYFWEAAD